MYIKYYTVKWYEIKLFLSKIYEKNRKQKAESIKCDEQHAKIIKKIVA